MLCQRLCYLRILTAVGRADCMHITRGLRVGKGHALGRSEREHLLGIAERVHAAQQRASKSEANQLSVKLELQAEFKRGFAAGSIQGCDTF